MPQYIRARVPGATYFFTVTLADRSSRLLAERIEPLRDAFRRVRADYPFTVNAVVVLPDHLHCIWTLPQGDSDFPERWRRIKARFSASLPPTESRSKSRTRKGERGIWQRRYWEHLIRDEADLAAHVDYIHFNPVKHGHAACAAGWPHSSFHRFVEKGLLPRDWGGNAQGSLDVGE